MAAATFHFEVAEDPKSYTSPNFCCFSHKINIAMIGWAKMRGFELEYTMTTFAWMQQLRSG